MNQDPLLRWFDCRHLLAHLQEVVVPFKSVAEQICARLLPSAERTVALRKLLEAKDAAVRAAILDSEQVKQETHIQPREG